MTQCINSLAQIAQKYDAIIFDQWGVLHVGSCAQAVGWDSVLIQKGLYASAFSNADHDIVLKTLLKDRACQPPTYSIEQLQ